MLWDKTGTQPCISFQAKLNTASGNVIFAYTRNIVLLAGTTPTGSTNITIPGGTGLLTAGMTVTGFGIPAGTTITSVNSGTQITINNATTSAIGSLTFGALPGTTVTNGSASIGLVGYCVGDYYSQTSSSTYSAGSWGKTVLFNNVNLRPSNNQVYTWAPGSPTWTPANDTCGSATTITFNPGALTTLTDQTIVMARQVTMASANPGLPGGWLHKPSQTMFGTLLRSRLASPASNFILTIPALLHSQPQWLFTQGMWGLFSCGFG